MRLQWAPCLLLYILQLVMLAGMAAGYVYMSYPKQPAPPANPQALLYEQASPGFGRLKISKVKPSVKMKPISVTYLRENLPKVTSRLELARLFMDADVNDHQLSRWMSRTIRSASRSTGHGLKLNHMPRGQNEEVTKHERQDHSVDLNSQQKDMSIQGNSKSIAGQSGSNSKKNGIGFHVDDPIKIVGVEDADYYTDYPQDEPTQEDLEAFEAALHHIDEVNTCSASKCKHPMPFVEHVHDPHDRNRMFIPECVVLHRCMNFTGCCGDGNHECAPKRMSIITKSFLVVDRHSAQEDYVMFNPSMTRTIDFVNHTECECREKPKMQKCTRACPKPFRLSQEGTSCSCDCFPLAYQDNWPCESVKEGVVQLSEDGLVCIKNGNCYIPECTEGRFEIKSGFCPLSDEYALPAFNFDNPNERRFYREHLRSYDFSNPHSKYTLSGKVATTHAPFSELLGASEDAKKETRERELKLQKVSSLSPRISSTVQSLMKRPPNFKYTVSGKDATTRASLSELLGASEDAKRENRERELKLQKLSSLSSMGSPTVQALVEKFESSTATKSNSTFQNRIVGNYTAVSNDTSKIRKAVGDEYHNSESSNATVAPSAENYDRSRSMGEKIVSNNITDVTDKLSSVSQIVVGTAETNFTQEGIGKTAELSEAELSDEPIYSEYRISDSQSSQFPKNKPSFHAESKFDSSTQNTIKKYDKKSSLGDKSHVEDDLTRRKLLKNNFRFSHHLSSQQFHENYNPIIYDKKIPALHEQRSNEHHQQKSQTTKPTSSLSSSSSFTVSFPQPSSFSKSTQSYLLTSSPRPFLSEPKPFKQKKLNDQKNPMISNDQKSTVTSNDQNLMERMSDTEDDILENSGDEPN